MPRPTTKAALLAQAETEYDALMAQINRLTEAQLCAPGCVGEWSAKDVLAHLTAWIEMFIGWYAAGQRGQRPAVPAEGYSWGELPKLNQRICEAHRDQPLEEVRAALAAAHQAVCALRRPLSEAELFQPKMFVWTGQSTLGSYAASCTSSHYLWARTEIRKGLRTRQTA